MTESALSTNVRRELREMAKQYRDLDAFAALRNRQIILAGELAEAAERPHESPYVELSWRDAELLRLKDFPAWTTVAISNYRLGRGPAWDGLHRPPTVTWKRGPEISANCRGTEVAFASFMPWLRKFVLPELKIEGKEWDGGRWGEAWDVSLYGIKADLRRHNGGGWNDVGYFQAKYRPNPDSTPLMSGYIYGEDGNDTAVHWCRLTLWDVYWDRVDRGLPVLCRAELGEEVVVRA